jgi:alpha-aminoadipate carrier protein LysW
MLCPECDSALDIDTEDIEEGDSVTCDECGTEFEIVATDPLELARADEKIDEDEPHMANEDEE